MSKVTITRAGVLLLQRIESHLARQWSELHEELDLTRRALRFVRRIYLHPEVDAEPVAPPSVPAEDLVTVCGWCSELHVLSMRYRESDCVAFYLHSGQIEVFSGLKRLAISHGICNDCLRREFEREPKGETDAL